ncbi:tyrosine-type recombinase/integrase [Nostoc sp. DSM 114167]|jgi:integrase|uniref:tyrosine-type recombinase/integrase n=1 Tax=Nostoc sp. DSM 114167 TaxID=3439050 RepID=UPI0040460721
MDAEDRWISVDKRSNKLVIRFSVRGLGQLFVSSGLEDTPQNRALVRIKRDMIVSDITLERFDTTLKSYQFQPRRNAIVTSNLSATYEFNLSELWEKFSEFKKSLLEPTTIIAKYKATGRYIAKLPTAELVHAAIIRDWLLKNTTHLMSWVLLNHFSECCAWAVTSGLIATNPFEKLKIKKPRRKSTEEEHEAFTLKERDLIIYTFEHHPVHNHHANLIKFLFFTGARLGETFALTWGDIQANCTRILFNKSCNLYRVRKGTKNGKRRIFPTSEGSKLQQMLLEMKANSEDLKPSGLVFVSKTGKPYNSCIMQQFWNVKIMFRGNKRTEYPGVVGALAAQGLVPYLKPYATRHTFATWAIASGATPEKVALWIGDEVQTVLKYYCHPNVVDSECPDF